MTLPVARLLMPALRWHPDTGFGHEAAGMREALALGVSGFIIFGGPLSAVSELVASVQERVGRPLLIGADLERGAGQQFDGLEELPPPGALASLNDLSVIRAAGRSTAAEARRAGINWVFAPVADLDLAPDNPIVQSRSFGDDPAWVAACVAAWVEGCQAAGVLACVKHFPGHGRTTTDSHAGLPLVTASRVELEADLQPFRAGIAAGVDSCMTAHVAYEALDGTRRPATLSPTILGLLRNELGFEGAVVSDALIMDGAFEGRSEGDAYLQAVLAGVDILLYPRNLQVAYASLAGALQQGVLPPERVARALGRVDMLVTRTRELVDALPEIVATLPPSSELADRLLAAPMLRGPERPLVEPIDLLVVDDDIGGPYPASPSSWTIRELQDAGIAFGSGGSRVVLAFAEPRAWKGRAGFSAENRARLKELAPDADLVVLFGHPRLVSEIPEPAPVLVAWHRQHLMQEAVARRLLTRLRG